MEIDENRIQRELAQIHGQLEWRSRFGVGVSLPPESDDAVFSRIPATLGNAVWINLENTQVSDAGLSRLEGLPVLESVRLAGTAVSAAGIEHLIEATPTLQEITIAAGQLPGDERARLRVAVPGVPIVEIA